MIICHIKQKNSLITQFQLSDHRCDQLYSHIPSSLYGHPNSNSRIYEGLLLEISVYQRCLDHKKSNCDNNVNDLIRTWATRSKVEYIE